MSKLKITTVSKEYRTAWVEVDDETFKKLSDGDGWTVTCWAVSQIDGGVETELGEVEPPEICFVDTESGEALYER